MLYNMPMAYEMIEAIIEKDNILIDIYFYYQDIFSIETINHLESGFRTIIYEYTERKNIYPIKNCMIL